MTAAPETPAASCGASGPGCGASTRKAIPDLDGRRYCRHCCALQPLSAFPKGKRRYVCRRHVWQCVKKQHRARILADVHRKMLFKQWQRCYADARTFQHTRIRVTQEDLAELIRAARPADTDPAVVAVVPCDPERVLCRDNAVVVHNEARLALLLVRRRHGSEAYAAALASWLAHSSTQADSNRHSEHSKGSNTNSNTNSTRTKHSCCKNSQKKLSDSA